jgi:hypothetical protein
MKRGLIVIIVLIILILFILLYIMPLKIQIFYKLIDKSNELEIYFKTLYGLINYKIDIPYIKMKFGDKSNIKYKINLEDTKDNEDITNNKKRFSIEEFKKSMNRSKVTYKKYKKVISYFMNKVLIKELKLNTEYDFKDAAVTGITAGILYSIESNLLLWILKYKKIQNYRFNINPLFKQENVIHINFSCIIQFKLGHIINGSIKSLILYKRR